MTAILSWSETGWLALSQARCWSGRSAISDAHSAPRSGGAPSAGTRGPGGEGSPVVRLVRVHSVHLASRLAATGLSRAGTGSGSGVRESVGDILSHRLGQSGRAD